MPPEEYQGICTRYSVQVEIYIWIHDAYPLSEVWGKIVWRRIIMIWISEISVCCLRSIFVIYLVFYSTAVSVEERIILCEWVRQVWHGRYEFKHSSSIRTASGWGQQFPGSLLSPHLHVRYCSGSADSVNGCCSSPRLCQSSSDTPHATRGVRSVAMPAWVFRFHGVDDLCSAYGTRNPSVGHIYRAFSTAPSGTVAESWKRNFLSLFYIFIFYIFPFSSLPFNKIKT